MLFLIGQMFYSLAIIQLHAFLFYKKRFQIRDQFFLYMDPELCAHVKSCGTNINVVN